MKMNSMITSIDVIDDQYEDHELPNNVQPVRRDSMKMNSKIISIDVIDHQYEMHLLQDDRLRNVQHVRECSMKMILKIMLIDVMEPDEHEDQQQNDVQRVQEHSMNMIMTIMLISVEDDQLQHRNRIIISKNVLFVSIKLTPMTMDDMLPHVLTIYPRINQRQHR